MNLTTEFRIMARLLTKVLAATIVLSGISSCEKEEPRPYTNYEKQSVVAPEIFSISHSVLNCSPPYIIHLKYTKNTSAETPTEQCSWTLYDSAIVSSCSSVYDTINTPGIYQVSLKISNYLGADSMTYTLDVSANSYEVTSAFSISDYTIYEDNSVSFTNNSTRASSYYWDFGDGYYSTLTHPSHLFTTPGTYTVKLIASCTGQSDSSTRTIYVEADPGYVYIDKFYLDLPISYLDSDGDDYNALPDYYIKVYVDGIYMKTTTTFYNISSFPQTWFLTNLSCHLGTNHSIEFKLYEYDSGSADEYVYRFYFDTDYLKSHSFPSGIWMGDYAYCYLSY